MDVKHRGQVKKNTQHKCGASFCLSVLYFLINLEFFIAICGTFISHSVLYTNCQLSLLYLVVSVMPFSLFQCFLSVTFHSPKIVYKILLRFQYNHVFSFQSKDMTFYNMPYLSEICTENYKDRKLQYAVYPYPVSPITKILH